MTAMNPMGVGQHGSHPVMGDEDIAAGRVSPRSQPEPPFYNSGFSSVFASSWRSQLMNSSSVLN
jgi:hypothetical protein